MPNEFERMKRLLETAGLNIAAGGIGEAELCGYAAGLALIREALESAEAGIAAPERYAALLGLDTEDLGENELRRWIVRRVSEASALPDGEILDTEFSLTGATALRPTQDGLLLTGFNLSRSKALAFFLASFLPVGVRITGGGSGLCFDQWEATGFTFREYDRLRLPFDLLDTLRSDTYEQFE